MPLGGRSCKEWKNATALRDIIQEFLTDRQKILASIRARPQQNPVTPSEPTVHRVTAEELQLIEDGEAVAQRILQEIDDSSASSGDTEETQVAS